MTELHWKEVYTNLGDLPAFFPASDSLLSCLPITHVVTPTPGLNEYNYGAVYPVWAPGTGISPAQYRIGREVWGEYMQFEFHIDLIFHWNTPDGISATGDPFFMRFFIYKQPVAFESALATVPQVYWQPSLRSALGQGATTYQVLKGPLHPSCPKPLVDFQIDVQQPLAEILWASSTPATFTNERRKVWRFTRKFNIPINKKLKWYDENGPAYEPTNFPLRFGYFKIGSNALWTLQDFSIKQTLFFRDP